MSTYHIVVTTNPDHDGSIFLEFGCKYLWSVYPPSDGRSSGHMPTIASGGSDTRWGARHAARRAIKAYERASSKPVVVVDEWLRT